MVTKAKTSFGRAFSSEQGGKECAIAGTGNSPKARHFPSNRILKSLYVP
jgi:hypothetical protein